jgi:hypothetical protein
VQQFFHILQIRTFFHRNQTIFASHDVANQSVHAAFKPDIPTGDNAHQVTAINHRQTRDIIGGRDINQFTNRGIRGNGDRVFHYAALVFFDLAHGGCLLLDGHALVHDADATFLCHSNSQIRLGHRVHG